MSDQGQVDPKALSALNAADREERDLRRAEREAGATIGAVGGAVGGLRRLGESMPRVLYEWHFAAGSGWKGRIVETEPGIIKAQQAKCGETEYYWDDVPGGPMGWANELVNVAMLLAQYRERAQVCRCGSPHLLAEVLATADDETEYTDWTILYARLEQYLNGTGLRGLKNLLGTMRSLHERIREIGYEKFFPLEPGAGPRGGRHG